ncbi:MAG TPA: hypothetical protein VF519_03575 [Mycobacteriales bacterium]|jgi:hypothetical protein
MPDARLAAAAAAVAAAVLAPAASAAGVACHLVVDPKGDQSHGTDLVPSSVYVSPDLDVVGADVASNKRHLTAVVRTASLREVDTDAPTGRAYAVLFTVNGHRYRLAATYGPDGYVGTASDEDKGAGLGGASVVLDHAKREVRISAPAATFGVAAGNVISGLAVTTGHHYGTNSPKVVPGAAGYGAYVGGAGLTDETDTASSTRTYVAGSRSCVTPGR